MSQTDTEANKTAAWRFVLLLAVALVAAFLAPRALFAATLQTVLFIAAAITAIGAMARREKIGASHFTRWDVAAALLALAFLAGLFIDVEEVQAMLERYRSGMEGNDR